ncbi:MAG: uracil-xanthine permease [Clostridia bacterium]|nr:uracil-xanthine permease [Clostridia bacterium]
MKLAFDIHDKPSFKQNVVFAIQQILAIITATILVPMLVNDDGAVNLNMDIAAALFGAGVGTLIYILFTKRMSPAFLGSSFAFISSMCGATVFGYFGIVVGAFIAGLVYVIIATVIHFAGSKWINKLMPPVIIGPTVALIGLDLAGGAIGNLSQASASVANGSYNLVAIFCGLCTLVITIIASVKGKKMVKLIPFIIGIASGYVIASIFTVIGMICDIDYLMIVNYDALVANFSNITLDSFIHIPKFAFVNMIKEITSPDFSISAADIGSIAMLFAPVAFVVFAEHIADHKNLSSIIGRDLVTDKPGLKRTLLGDGVGTMAGAFFGGCANTTYGESVACVAITGNASVSTIFLTAIFALIISFFSPIVAFINTIPTCVIGGICIALYGFIAVSGLRMLKDVDLGDNKNLFVVSTILICGIGGLTLKFGQIQLTKIATALILGIIVNLIIRFKENKSPKAEE